jgi:hypothetical protein
MVLRAARLVVASLLLAGLFGVGFAVDVETTLGLAPALLIAVPLLAGRYLGERGLRRLAAAAAAGRRRRVVRPRGGAPVGRGEAEDDVVRGGLVLARRLAGRAPPAGRAVALSPTPTEVPSCRSLHPARAREARRAPRGAAAVGAAAA